VIDDVAPYAIVFGSPAKVVRKRFSDDIIAALLAVRWWDLSRDQIDALRPLLLGRDVGKFIDEVRKIRRLSPLADEAKPAAAAMQDSEPAPLSTVVQAVSAAPFSDDRVLALIREECSALTGDDLDKPFEDLGVDSFGMLTLRTKLEEASGKIIDDETWSSVRAPSDAVRVFSDVMPARERVQIAAVVRERRDYHVNLPQMAAGGISESWLFKEIGDLHWSQISKGLGVPRRKCGTSTATGCWRPSPAFRSIRQCR